MKLLQFSVPLLLLSTVIACDGQTLDGGSNTSGSSSGGASSSPSAPSGSPSGASATQDGIPTTPFAGTVTGQPFTPTAFELRPETKSPRWSLEIHNASEPCARGRKMGDEIVIVTIDGLGGEGSWPLDPGDAQFQRGFYMGTDSKVPEHDVSNTGRVRLDIPPGATGTTVTGALRVAGDTSELSGAFTATVCEPY